jgi:hypothetical protein
MRLVITVTHALQMTWMSGSQAILIMLVDDFDGVKINIIDLPHLKANKRSAGRLKTLADLENLP